MRRRKGNMIFYLHDKNKAIAENDCNRLSYGGTRYVKIRGV